MQTYENVLKVLIELSSRYESVGFRVLATIIASNTHFTYTYRMHESYRLKKIVDSVTLVLYADTLISLN